MYKVESFYGKDLRGLEESESFEDWEEVKDFAHELISHGGYVRITNEYTGKEVVLDPDTYFDNFEGEFPVDQKSLDTVYFPTEEQLEHFKRDFIDENGVVRIPDGVEHILGGFEQHSRMTEDGYVFEDYDYSYFAGYKEIKEMILPDSLKDWDRSAFMGCDFPIHFEDPTKHIDIFESGKITYDVPELGNDEPVQEDRDDI